MMPPFRVRTLGQGPRVLLVHGSVTNSVTWSSLRGLGRSYTLVLPDRPGYPPNPPLARIDFETQADELAELLGESAHVVGFSYGGVISLLLAGRNPERVRSLTVIEPPCFGVAEHVPAIRELSRDMQALWAEGEDDPAVFLPRFAASFGAEGQVPPTVQPGREQGVRALMVERGPWEAEIPLEALAGADFPTLVCSAGSHPAYEAVCDVLAERTGGERVVLRGAGHAVHLASGFRERLERFLAAAEDARARRSAGPAPAPLPRGGGRAGS
ncbi:MAG: alpha/beta hydrolase [Actinobacteria bacterium]|nr:alpha/beta hydrolase [Actinomycetota bacterium]